MSAIPTSSITAQTNPATSIAIIGVSVLHHRLLHLDQRSADRVRAARFRRQRDLRVPGADGVLPVVLLPRAAGIVAAAPHRHEEGPGAEPAGDGGRRGRCSASSRRSAGIPGALLGLFVIGGGLALLQTAVNPYISILGPIESAAQRIALMGICNKIGRDSGADPARRAGAARHRRSRERRSRPPTRPRRRACSTRFAAKIHMPYLAMAGVLVVARASAILLSPLPELQRRRGQRHADPGARRCARATACFQFPHVWLGALCIFVYVGVEVMAGDAIGTYGRGFELPLDHTKFFTSFTLGGDAGRLSGRPGGDSALHLARNAISRARRCSACCSRSALIFTHGYVSVGFVAALGFANAMMWPAIFPLAIRGLGRFTEKGSALLIMGIAGGAIIPQLFAVLKQHYDFQAVFLCLMVPCYLYILFYALRGHRVGLRPRALRHDVASSDTTCDRHAQTHDQGRRRAGQGLAEDGVARDQQRAVGDAGHARARAACDRRTQLRTRSVRAQPAQRDVVRDRPGLRQPQPVPHHRRAERRARGVPRNRLRPADPSLRLHLADARRRTGANWCAAFAPRRAGADRADVGTHGTDRVRWPRAASSWCASSPRPRIRTTAFPASTSTTAMRPTRSPST